MSVHSGKFAVVNGVRTVRNWTVNDVSQNPKYVASNTLFGTGRKTGVRSWTGNFNVYGHSPLVLPGEFFDFQGYTAPDDDESGSGQVYEGEAIVDSIQLTWNWANGELMSHVANFSGNMELTPGSGVFSDETVPDAFEVSGTKVEYSPMGVAENFVQWPNLTQAVLTISSANQSYVNSDTVASGETWTGRKSGALDWTLALTEQEVTRTVARAVNTNHDLKLFVTSGLFWRLKWGKIENYSNINANRETGAIITRVANLAKNGFDNDGNAGIIQMPDGTVIWPPASTSSSP